MFCHFFHQRCSLFSYLQLVLIECGGSNVHIPELSSQKHFSFYLCTLTLSARSLRMLTYIHQAKKRPKMKDQVDKKTQHSKLPQQGQ